MGIFDNMLKGDESLFLNEIALDFDYLPKEVPFRENENKQIAECIKPLFSERTGTNLFIFGSPGIGKTVAVKNVFRELKTKTDSIKTIYINCWKLDTSFKMAVNILEQLDYKWIHNKRTDELLKVISSMLNKKSVVFCFDEVDKAKETDIFYTLSEDILRKSILLVTNEKNWLSNLDNRVKSRLMLDMLEFRPYGVDETEGILRQRRDFVFVPGVFDNHAFELVVGKTHGAKDMRTGLFLMRESGNIAESSSSRKIKEDHVKLAILKQDKFKIKSSADFGEEERRILNIVKEHSGKTIKDIYDVYRKVGGDKSYRTFHRSVNDLKVNKMILVEERGGTASNVVRYSKKLTDF